MNKIQIIRLLPLIVLAFIAAVLATGLLNIDPRRGALLGKTPGNFSIDVVGARKTKMTPDAWKGQVAVINVFASWCKPCQMEHGVIMRLASSGKVNVYGIAWRDQEQNIIKYLTAGGNPYQMVGNDQFGVTTLPLALTGVPETMVVDRTGKVYYHQVSALTNYDLEHTVMPLIERLQASNAPAR